MLKKREMSCLRPCVRSSRPRHLKKRATPGLSDEQTASKMVDCPPSMRPTTLILRPCRRVVAHSEEDAMTVAFGEVDIITLRICLASGLTFLQTAGGREIFEAGASLATRAI